MFAKEPFSGSANLTKNFARSMEALVIVNDSNSDLTFTIANDTYTVKSGEIFDEELEPFLSVSVTATGPFRGYGRRD